MMRYVEWLLKAVWLGGGREWGPEGGTHTRMHASLLPAGKTHSPHAAVLSLSKVLTHTHTHTYQSERREEPIHVRAVEQLR